MLAYTGSAGVLVLASFSVIRNVDVVNTGEVAFKTQEVDAETRNVYFVSAKGVVKLMV